MFFRARRALIVERKTISIMKACELVGVSRCTIYNWLSSGKIEYVRTTGGSVRIFVDTLWRDPKKVEPEVRDSVAAIPGGLEKGDEVHHRKSEHPEIGSRNGESVLATIFERNPSRDDFDRR